MSSKSLTKKRLQEVVFMAISGVLPSEKVNDAYDNWLQSLKDTKEFSIVGLISDFSEMYAFTEADKRMFKNIIYDNLFIKEKSSYSGPSSTKPPAEKAKNKTIRTDEFETFTGFMKILIDKGFSAGLNFSMMSDLFSDLIDKTDIDSSLQASLINWIQHQDDTNICDILTLSDMNNAIHTMYLVLCDGIGPVKADEVLSNSVQKAKTLPSAEFFAPEKFL